MFFPEQRKLCVVALLAAADDLLGLRQQPGKGLLVGRQLADLLDDLGVQRVAVAVFHRADCTVAALLGGAHVGVDQLAVRRAAVGQLRMECLLLLVVYRTILINFKYYMIIFNLNFDRRVYLLRKFSLGGTKSRRLF